MGMDIEQRLAHSGVALDATIESYLAGGRPGKDRRRWVVSAAAAALVVVGIGGVALLGEGNDRTSGQTATSTLVDVPDSSAPSVGPTPGAEVWSFEAGQFPTADADLLGFATALMLPSMSGEEALAFFSMNIPEVEIASCMSAAGFDYVPEATPEELVAGDVRYTMSPEAYAATYGFGITGSDLGIIPMIESTINRAADGSGGGEKAAYGQTLGECRGVFDPERRALFDAMTVTVAMFGGVVSSDERMVAGLTAWQSCLAAAGHEYDTPLAMRESFSLRMNTVEGLRQIFDDEVRVAVVNVLCEAAYNDVQREVISGRFTEFKGMFDAALASGASPDAQG